MDISNHYEQSLESNLIISSLREAYPGGANQYQLAPIDQLHIGGIKASEKLIKNLCPTDNVLEIGSGSGGLMRLAQAQGISITGVDISHGLNCLNRRLSGLRFDFESLGNPKTVTADAHRLPISDNSITAVVFQHSLLNMPDAQQALNECRRVLQPSGRLILHEVIRGHSERGVIYPVPWATCKEESFILEQVALTKLLTEVGLDIQRVSDWSDEALNWSNRQQSKGAANQHFLPVTGPEMILGKHFKQMVNNVNLNLAKGSIRIVEIVCLEPE